MADVSGAQKKATTPSYGVPDRDQKIANQSPEKPSNGPDWRKNEGDPSTADGDVEERRYPMCTQTKRRRFVRDYCRETKLKPAFHSAIWATFINMEKKIFLCVCNKAATGSLKDYFLEVNRQQMLKKEVVVVQYRRLGDQPPSGFYQVEDIPVEEVSKRFHGFTKILMVRHPLQRFVSGYYQTAVSKQSSLARKSEDIDSLSDFIDVLVKNESLRARRGTGAMIWEDVQNTCHPCHVDYSYIFKTETLSRDVLELHNILGLETFIDIPLGHAKRSINSGTNSNVASDSYKVNCDRKYDAILRELNQTRPDLFSYVLERYREDMEMFGYSWIDDSSSCMEPVRGCC